MASDDSGDRIDILDVRRPPAKNEMMRREALVSSVSNNRSPTAGGVGQSLLATKLAVPLVRSDVVIRERLLGRLDEGRRGRLTLVAAPAGFGKTTLLAGWIQRRGVPVGWVSLDGGDDDLTRFWTYAIAALEAFFPGAGVDAVSLLHQPQPPPIEGVLTALINGITEASSDGVLVLDDFHLVSSPAVHESISFLVENLPTRLHLIVATRADPPLSLARLRARGHLSEIRAADLRFTADEVDVFFRQTVGSALTPGDREALESRTEGWIAGLQLAALSLRGREDVGGFVRAFTGSHRFIVDYLAQEVLARLPDETRTFLLETSILKRLTGALTEAVTEQAGGDSTLEQLEQANLFLVPLDDERRWYRYHQLFADVLQHQLQRAFPGRAPTLHARASRWFADQGHLREAIEHALASGDIDWYASLVDRAAPVLLGRGEIVTAKNWLRAIPRPLVLGRPRLAIAQAWLLYFDGQLDDAEHLLVHVESQVAEAGSAENATRGAINTIRAFIALNRNDLANASRFARQALDDLPRDNGLRGILTLNLGWISWLGGDIEAATRAFVESIDLSRSSGNVYGVFVATAELAELLVAQGKLCEAERVCRKELLLVPERDGTLPASGLAYVGLGDLYRERNELENAGRNLQEGMRLCQSLGNGPANIHGLICLARLEQARGDGERALAACDEARRLTQQHKMPEVLLDNCAALRALLLLRQGKLAEASRWANALDVAAGPASQSQNDTIRLILARVHLAEGRPDRALTILDGLQKAAEGDGRSGTSIEILTVLALVLHSHGDVAAAVNTLAEAVGRAEPENYVRTFVDEGAPLLPLLLAVRDQLCAGAIARAKPTTLAYVDRLLRALRVEVHATAKPGTERTTVETTEIVEATTAAILSDRELDVLRLIAEGCSNREIADRLVLAVSTVKWYVNTIFTKLDVDSRTKAIARARRDGIIRS